MPKKSSQMVYGALYLHTVEEKQYCLIEDKPIGTGLRSVDADNPTRGEKAAHLYPADARVYMSTKWKGTKLPDFVSNVESLLIVSRRVKEVIEKINQRPIEYIPISIHDQKQKLASADYFIVNPLGCFDILDFDACDVDRDEKGAVYAVHKMVFSASKMKGKQIPDLFRPKGDVTQYVISRNIARELIALEPPVKNLHYSDLVEVSNGKSRNLRDD